MLTFYFTPGASSMATHIALHEVGAPFESRLISLTKHENRTPKYLALNPEGKVPTLVIDGRALTEVAANLWTRERFPAAGLLPQNDLAAEAEVVSWMSFIAATIHPARPHQRRASEGRAPLGGAAARPARLAIGATRSRTSICSGFTGASITR